MPAPTEPAGIQARKVARAEFVTRAFIVALVVLVVGMVAAFVVKTGDNGDTLDAIRATQLDGTPLGKKLAAQADTIEDCTTPEGECYKRGQAATAKAVGDINRVIVLAAACAVGLDQGLTVDERQTEIQQCVIDRLAQQAAKPR